MFDIRDGDRMFWYTTTGWMMWNFLVGSMLVGGVPVLYDGSPGHPNLDVLWDLAARARVSLFGTSAAFLAACQKAGIRPGETNDLSHLEAIGSTGSPLAVETFGWVYDAVKPDVWLASMSGGTDVVSAFVGGCPLLPVHAGELQARALGAKVEAFDEAGRSVVGQTGELVLTAPLPSMPVGFWNDPDGDPIPRELLRDVSGRLAPRRLDPDHRAGERGHRGPLGLDAQSPGDPVRHERALRRGRESPGGRRQPGHRAGAAGRRVSDAAVRGPCRRRRAGRRSQRHGSTTAIRAALSQRHVPDEIVAVPAIPRTLTGKKMEVPVKRLLQGRPLAEVAASGSVADPKSLEWFVGFAKAAERHA